MNTFKAPLPLLILLLLTLPAMAQTDVIPEGVTSIPSSAFPNCNGITNVAIPATVTDIGFSALAVCPSLMEITVSPLNASYRSVDGVLFDKNMTVLIQCPGGRSGSYTVPNTVTGISASAFSGCSSLTEVRIPNSVTSIGNGLLYDNGTFFRCTSLIAITVDPMNPSYSSVDGVLFDKTETTLIQYPNGRTGSYTIPSTVTSIRGGWAYFDLPSGGFSGCTSLTDVTIPDSVTDIGEAAFELCTSLKSVTIGKSVTRIPSYAFFGCSSLTNILIPNSVINIDSKAFWNCNSLTNITIPQSVTSISDYAFSYSGLMGVTVDPRNTFYSSTDGILFDKNKTRLINFPNNKPGSYRIPSGVTNIAGAAFRGCGSLISVTVPGTVTSIDGTFSQCDSLVAFYFEGDSPNLGPDAFSTLSDSSNATAYYLPGTTGWSSTFGGAPTALWVLPNPTILNNVSSFGAQTNDFGFTISWAMNRSVVVDASTSLTNPAWSPIGTNTLVSGSSYFSDPQSKKYPNRFYRLRSL